MAVVINGTTGIDTIQDDAVGLAQMASGTDGNLITYDASGNPAAVAVGTSGQVLTSNGAGSAPTMQAGGKVLQVVSTLVTASSSQSVGTGSTVAVTSVSVTITPSSASSKIRIMARWGGETTENINCVFGIARGGTQINLPTANGSNARGLGMATISYTAANNDTSPEYVFITTLDSPASTSPQTYTLTYTNSGGGTNTIYNGRCVSTSTGLWAERMSNEIIAEEIGA